MHTPATTLALSCALAAPVLAAPSIQRLEFAPGVTGQRIIATDVSADGSVVSLKATFDGFGSRRPGYWTPSTGVLPFAAPNSSISFGVHVSDDGSTFATTAGAPSRAYTWTRNDPPTAIPLQVSTGASSIGAISADGSTVVGTATFNTGLTGFIYSEQGGMAPLPGDRPEGLSADGSTVAGTDRIESGSPQIPNVDRPWIWSEDTGKAFLTGLDDFDHTAITHGLSPDGSTAFGSLLSPHDLFEPSGWRWSASAGLQTLDNFSQSPFTPDILGSTADASILVGGAYDGNFSRAAIWLADSPAPIHAASFFASHGVTIPAGWSINDVTAVSPDGRFFVGDAFDNAQQFSWIIEVPTPSSITAAALVCAFTARRRRL